MVLDSRIATLREHFGIAKPEDWCAVHPEAITAVPDIGPQTLNHLRLMLANRGLTLRGDETPAYWQSHLDTLRGASQIAGTDTAIITPFTVLIDADEQQPFTFQGLRADADRNGRPLIIRTARKHLGNTHGDYSIEGLEDFAHVERKSMADAQSTVLGWGDRREQFQRTLEYLSELPAAMVVVECSFMAAIVGMTARGKKSVDENRKIFHRQALAWMNDYRVPWVFCDDRRFAEITTFRFLERQWRHEHARRKRAAIDAAQAEIQTL